MEDLTGKQFGEWTMLYMTTNEMEEQMNEIFTNPVTTTVT